MSGAPPRRPGRSRPDRAAAGAAERVAAGQGSGRLLDAHLGWALPRRSDGRIAQLVEQLTLNQRVQGSSPCAPTITSNASRDMPQIRCRNTGSVSVWKTACNGSRCAGGERPSATAPLAPHTGKVRLAASERCPGCMREALASTPLPRISSTRRKPSSEFLFLAASDKLSIVFVPQGTLWHMRRNASEIGGFPGSRSGCPEEDGAPMEPATAR